MPTPEPYISNSADKHPSRREFLKLFSTGIGALGLSQVIGCEAPSTTRLRIPVLKASSKDKVLTAEGLDYHLISAWGDKINSTQHLGMNCDFTAFLPDPSSPNRDGRLWINHESIQPMFLHRRKNAKAETKDEAQLEREQVGGSLIRISKNPGSGHWELIPSNDSFRIDGSTKIPFANGVKVLDQSYAIGTLGNCSGGTTPWGSILTAEENYDQFVGERAKDNSIKPSKFGWETFFEMPPEHYGWITEIDPNKKTAQKLTSLGRCAHECATVAVGENGIPVVYTGDDKAGECLYKFISKETDNLNDGTIHVAHLERGEWIPLTRESQPILAENFKTNLDILIELRKAAHLVGGTRLDRPEDIDIDPINGSVVLTLTNNKSKGNFHGSIIKLTETQGRTGLKFRFETLFTGGEESGFTCPDNIAFDPNGNLWFTTDISEKDMNEPPYSFHGNNALFIIPRSGPQAGHAIRVAQAPKGAEFTGPSFGPNGRTLFLSVQHPGAKSKSLKKIQSNWPDGKDSIPRSGVIAISGKLLDRISMQF